MSEYKLALSNIDDLNRRLKSLSAAFSKKGVHRGLVNAVSPIKKTAKQLAPSKTGKLSASIGHMTLSQTAKGRLGIQHDVALLIGANRKKRKDRQTYKHIWVEFGTEAHEIKPWKKGVKKSVSFGGFAYAKVKHPGTKANPFMAKSLAAHDQDLVPRFWQGVEQYLERIDR